MPSHTAEEHVELYGQLRAQVLSRFFAYGRYFRSNHLSIENYLGLVRDDATPPPPDTDDLAVDCGDRTVERPSTYADSAGLLAMPDADQEFERWRIANHTADNPLMLSCHLLVALAVEYTLGRPGALSVLRLAVDGLAAMFKFGSVTGYEGYPIRRDAVSSDNWVTRDQGGQSVPWYCCEFLLDGSFQHLYCTPFTHPDYVPYDPTEFYAEDPNQPGHFRTYSGNDDWPPRQASLNRCRAWEPSMDELVGLIPAYDFVFFLVNDPVLREQIQKQVSSLSSYLSAHGYLLVRPSGGFAARGGSGVLPAMEYPFSRVFQRITGQAPAPAASFEQAMIDGGVWDGVRPHMQRWGIVGAASLAAALGILGAIGGVAGSFLAPIAATIGAVLGAVAGYYLGRAFGIYTAQNSFDVWNADQRSEFISCYLLKQLSVKYRFTSWMSFVNRGKFAKNFPQFLGLAGVADTTDTTVRNAFISSLPGARSDARGKFGNTGFASAVAVALGQSSEESNLRKFLDDAFDSLTGPTRNRMPMLADDAGPFTVERIRNTLPNSTTEDPMNPLEYMACMALNWLRAKQLSDSGASVGTDLLAFPPGSAAWPTPSVPASVLQAGLVPALGYVTSGRTPVDAFPGDDSAPPPQDARPEDAEPAPPPVIQTDTYTVSVPESQLLVDPGVIINLNDQVSITASGTIWAGAPFSGRNGPGGWSEITTNSNYPRTGTNRYCLLYKIVPPGTDFLAVVWQKLGTSLSFAAVSTTNCGSLYLRTNDDEVGNGNGDFSCDITIQRAGP